MKPSLRRALPVLFAGAAVVASSVVRAQPQPPAPAFNPRDVLPFDAAVQTATLPNGLTYFVRQNSRPAHRVSLRLAVKAGSLNEAEDQRGLAHLIEHMAFNGSTHFKPGEVFSYFESVGARLGPHVNAYTSFDQTVYMLDLPTDNPEVVQWGLTALADFAGGLTLSQEEVDKERGVVIEEWRGGLGASSRIRDKQFPVLFYHSRYAERLPIGKPEVIRNAPVARLRAFYDTWYRPDHMAVVAVGDIDPARIAGEVRNTFAPLTARAPAAPEPDRSVPLDTPLLVNVATDPEVTRSSVTIESKRPREDETHVADYRRDLVQSLIGQMMDDRFAELVRRPDAKFLSAGAGGGELSRTVATFTFGATVQDGKIADGLSALAIEARRVRQFGFSDSEVDRAKKGMAAFYERAYRERDKTDSASFADEYLRHFLDNEPSPGIAYEYRLVQQALPTITTAEASAMARGLLSGSSRVVLAVSPQKDGIAIPSDADLRATLDSTGKVTVTAWNDTTATRGLMDHTPPPAAVTSRRMLDDVGVTIVTFANGVEAWLKPTDFKNDQVLFGLQAEGGASLAPPADFTDAELAPGFVGLSGAGGLKALDLEKVLTGKLVRVRPYISLSTHGVTGSAAPADLETALQLLHQEITAPGDDPDAFALLKRQLGAMVANRGRSPGQVFAEKVERVNTSNHYTSEPLTADEVAALDRGKMMSFYKQRFANAADFTFFMVGAFKVDDAVPLLARYVGTLPSTGKPSSTFRDVGIHFPQAAEREKVVQGREPKSQTVISFFADPGPDPMEQETLQAVTTVLDIALRDILREDLGQTYTVSVGLAQELPQRGGGHIEVSFGAAPENIEGMTARVMQEIARLQEEGPSADLTNRAKEAARRSYETSLKQNEYWLRRLETVKLLGRNPSEILTRNARIARLTPQTIQAAFTRYFPADRSTIVTLMPAKAP